MLNQLIGLKIVGIKGLAYKYRSPQCIQPKFILFNDKMTILRLEEQDFERFHDCDTSARTLEITK